MSFVEKNLSANERILYRGKLHGIIYLRGLVFIAVALCFSTVSYAAVGLFFLIGVFSLFNSIAVARSSEFVITNKRVIMKTGMLRRKLIELQLNRAEGLVVDQGVIGRIFNYGSIKITSGGATESFSPLAKPYEFKKEVNNAIEGSFVVNPAVA